MSEIIESIPYEMKENILTPFSKDPDENNEQQKFIIKKKVFSSPFIAINGFYLYFFFSGQIFFSEEKLYIKIIYILIFFPPLAYINYLLFLKRERKIELIKDVKNNEFIINKLNVLNKPIAHEILNLNSIIFYDVSYITHKEDVPHTTYGHVIVNTFNDKSNIDLDESDIKTKPRKIFYLLDDIGNGNLNIKLSMFVGCSPEPVNPIFLDINRYMGKPFDNKISLKFGKYRINKYMKISDTFFAFYFKERGNYICCLIIFDAFMAFFSLTGLIYCLFSDLKLNIKIIISVIVYIFFMSIFNSIYLYFFIKFRNRYIIRIDIIYSNNFDKIFIGLVNYNEKSYLNTFLFEMDTIDKFILEPLNKSQKKNNLKIILKTLEVRLICRINEDISVLEGLLYILNEKLNINNSNTKENDNLLIKDWK